MLRLLKNSLLFPLEITNTALSKLPGRTRFQIIPNNDDTTPSSYEKSSSEDSSYSEDESPIDETKIRLMYNDDGEVYLSQEAAELLQEYIDSLTIPINTLSNIPDFQSIKDFIVLYTDKKDIPSDFFSSLYSVLDVKVIRRTNEFEITGYQKKPFEKITITLSFTEHLVPLLKQIIEIHGLENSSNPNLNSKSI